MEEVKSNAWIQNTIKNYPNSTTLFLPNGVLRAKPNLNLTLKLSKKPPKKSKARTLNRKNKRPRKHGSREEGRRPAVVLATGRRPGDGWLSPALAAAPLFCSCSTPSPRRVFGLARRAKLILLFLSFFVPFFVNLAWVYSLSTKVRKTNKKPKDYIIKRTKT